MEVSTDEMQVSDMIKGAQLFTLFQEDTSEKYKVRC